MSRLSEYSEISGVVFDEVDDLLGGIEAGGGSTIEDLTDDEAPQYISGPNGVRLGWNPTTNQFDIPLNAPTATGGGGGGGARTTTTTVNGQRVIINLDTGAIVAEVGPASAADMAKSQFITGKNPTTGKTDKALIYVDSDGQPHTIWFNVPVTGSGTGAASNTLRSGSASVSKAQASASPSTPGISGGWDKKALGSSSSALNSLMVRKGMTNFEPEGYGSPSKMGDLAFDIAKQGPGAAFRYGAPVSSFEYTSPNATLGPFGGIGSGGLSGEIQSTGPQTFMIGGGLNDSAGYGGSAPMILQAYAPAGKSLITGDPVQDQAAAVAITAMRDQMIAEGVSPTDAQSRIQRDLATQDATYAGTPGAFYPGYARGGQVEVNVGAGEGGRMGIGDTLWSRDDEQSNLQEGWQDSPRVNPMPGENPDWAGFAPEWRDWWAARPMVRDGAAFEEWKANRPATTWSEGGVWGGAGGESNGRSVKSPANGFPSLPLGMAQRLYDEQQRQVMSYRRRLAGLPEETVVYANTNPGPLPLGMRYEAPPTGYGFTDPGISSSVMTAADYALQQRQKAVSQANLVKNEEAIAAEAQAAAPPPKPTFQQLYHGDPVTPGYVPLAQRSRVPSYAGGGQMITQEEIIGIGRDTGRPYFRVGEDANGDGSPDPELLSIRPLRNMRRRPSPRLPLGIMASAHAG